MQVYSVACGDWTTIDWQLGSKATILAICHTLLTTCTAQQRLEMPERGRAGRKLGVAHRKEGGRAGTGSPPCTRRREVPTREWKAFLKGRFPTRGLPNVMHLTSAPVHCSAAQAAPAEVAWPGQLWVTLFKSIPEPQPRFAPQMESPGKPI